MKLSIFSLNKVLFQGQAELLSCNTLVGQITILDHHQPFIGVMKKGVARVVDKNHVEHFFEVSSGFLEVQEDSDVRCMIE